MSSDNKLDIIFKKLEINVPKDLLQTAFTHSSLTFENNEEENYERLEFLGDSVLKLLISEYLYKSYPEYPEGRMTKIRAILVSDSTLAKIGIQIGLPEKIRLSKSEEKDHGRNKESVIACSLEAILGAIYLSSGIKASMSFIKELYKNLPEQIDNNLEIYNAKAVLQEYTQKNNKDLPEYKELLETGKAHNKTFTFGVFYRNEFISQGSGKTKREAQQNAAMEACIRLGLIEKGNVYE